jgi:hypothetical protein
VTKNSQNAMEKIGVLKAVQKNCGEKRKYHQDSTTFHTMLANTHPTKAPSPHKTHAIQIHLALCSHFMVELGFFHHCT